MLNVDSFIDDPPIVLMPDPGPSWETVLGWFNKREEWEDVLCTAITENPLESLSGLLVGSSALFYAVEHGVNPRIKTFWDALFYITTCASVGYANVFAMTSTGKAIASVVFTFGPALCAKVFDRPHLESQPAQPGIKVIIDRLEAILAELRRRETPA